MLSQDIICFKNSVDPDQLSSKKQADQDPHCFSLCLQIRTSYSVILQSNWITLGKNVVHKTIQHDKG